MIVELCIMIVGTLRRLFASYLFLTQISRISQNIFLSDESEFLHKTNPWDLWDLCEPIVGGNEATWGFTSYRGLLI